MRRDLGKDFPAIVWTKTFAQRSLDDFPSPSAAPVAEPEAAPGENRERKTEPPRQSLRHPRP